MAFVIETRKSSGVCVEAEAADKGKALVDFLWWGIHDGEQFAQDLQYAPLPAEIVKRAEAKISSITSGGKPLR